MHYLSIDSLIVCAFLLLTLAVGLWAGRGIKDMREYAIANKQFGTGAFTITLLATYIGGWHLFGFPSDVFADGIIHIIPDVVCGVVVCFLFIALFIIPKMTRFKDCLTMGDLMRIFYGEYGQIITGVLGLMYNTAAIGVQIVFLGHFCELLGIKSDWGLILAALILTIYTAKGGMKAVVMTDILQFTAIVAVIPLLAHLITYQAGGIRALLRSVPQEKLQLFNFGQDKAGAFSASYYAFPISTLWMLFPGFPLSFPFIQRMLMAKQQQQSVNAYYISIAFMIPFFLLLTLIGLAALSLYPQINSKDVITHIVSNLPVGLKGLMWIALLAVVMSTTDSFLHASGVSLTHDLIKPCLAKKGIAINELKVVQYATLLIGCLAIVVVLKVRTISKMAMYGMDLAALLFTIPLIAGIMGLKTDIRSFLVSLFATLTLFAFAQPYLSEDLAIPICILANALSFFGTHYLQHRGFAVVHRVVAQQIGYAVWHPTKRGISQRLISLLPTPKKFLNYSRGKLEKYGADSTLFALFMSFSYMIPIFMHGYAAPHVYNWLLAIRGLGALLCVGLLLKSYWPQRLLAYFPSYYHLSLLYCLPFTASFLFFLEGSNTEWLINVALTIMFLIVLVDWMSFIILTSLGVALGFFFYQTAIGPIDLQLDFSTGYLLVYTCVFSTIVALIFARRKEQHLEAKLREIAEHHYTMAQGEAYTHPATLRIATMIERQVQEVSALYHQPSSYDTVALQKEEPHTDPDFLQYFFPTALEVIKQGNQLNQHLVRVIMTDGIAPHLSLFSLQACVAAILEAYQNRHPQSMHVDLSEDYRIYTSFNHLQYALIHVLRFLQAHHLGDQVRIWTTHKEGIHMRLSGQVLSPSLLHELCTLFPPKETAKHLGIAISRVLIEAQGGRLLYETHALPQNPYTEFIITLPPAEESPFAS